MWAIYNNEGEYVSGVYKDIEMALSCAYQMVKGKDPEKAVLIAGHPEKFSGVTMIWKFEIIGTDGTTLWVKPDGFKEIKVVE